ncbi:MAG: hypothetical protein DMD30_12230 [Gemmatimonadetes bacterium]|nr:MAG: hypothetical protein DMD30_12230 [Gemmatimonadota bacterium]
MTHTHGEGALFLALFAALAGCADPASRAVAPASSREIVSEPTSAPPSDERVALTKIARLVAVAMDNEPARQRLKRDMRAAPFREHKLELASYLRSKDGAALLGRMAALSGGGETAVFVTLAAIRPLELYMPVAKHRESWTGKADVLVVSQLDEWQPIVAFDQRGQQLALDRKVPPEQPTLSIVPVETRFDQPMPASGSRNVRDQDGNAIGTLERMAVKGSSLISCGETCDGGGSGSTSPTIPPGIYLEFSRILDAKEPWFRGDPEIEVHIQGPYMGNAPTYAEDLSCSGEHAYDPRKVFDQNGGFWEGRVMLFAEDEVLAFTQKFSNGFHVMFWEDDNQPCTLKLDANPLADFVKSASTALGTVAIKVFPGAQWKLVAAAFVATLFANPGSWLLTNDDFLGVAVDQASAGNLYPDNTHVIIDEGQVLNGRANIVYHH